MTLKRSNKLIVSAEAFCPWAPEATILAKPDAATSAVGGQSDDNWADFDSVSFGELLHHKFAN